MDEYKIKKIEVKRIRPRHHPQKENGCAYFLDLLQKSEKVVIGREIKIMTSHGVGMFHCDRITRGARARDQNKHNSMETRSRMVKVTAKRGLLSGSVRRPKWATNVRGHKRPKIDNILYKNKLDIGGDHEIPLITR